MCLDSTTNQRRIRHTDLVGGPTIHNTKVYGENMKVHLNDTFQQTAHGMFTHGIFCVRPADSLKNWVWTLLLRRLGKVYIRESVNWVILGVNYIISNQQRLLWRQFDKAAGRARKIWCLGTRLIQQKSKLLSNSLIHLWIERKFPSISDVLKKSVEIIHFPLKQSTLLESLQTHFLQEYNLKNPHVQCDGHAPK